MTKADEPSAIQQALDLFVHAPIGVYLELRESLPKTTQRGRDHLKQRVDVARFIGSLAAAQLKVEASKLERAGREQADGVLDLLFGRGSSSVVDPESKADEGPGADLATHPTDAKQEGFPISDYQSLPASVVVKILDGLPRDQLEAIREFEASNRNRKTILTKIDRLTA